MKERGLIIIIPITRGGGTGGASYVGGRKELGMKFPLQFAEFSSIPILCSFRNSLSLKFKIIYVRFGLF